MPTTEYYRLHSEEIRAKRRNYYYANRQSEIAKSKAYRLANFEKVKETQRNYDLTHRQERRLKASLHRATGIPYKNAIIRRCKKWDSQFGWEPGTTKIKLESQQTCELCGEPFDILIEGRCATVDHDHATGRFRGIIHQSCNVAIGILKDSPRLCIKAATYLTVPMVQAQAFNVN